MADLIDTPTLPPLLMMLKERQPGELYALAAKDHLITGALDCTRHSITNAAWSDDYTALTLYFGAYVRTTLTVEGFRIVAVCDCRQWQPGRQCPHVVMAWAVLKRLLSPATLVHIRFNEQLLRDVAVMVGVKYNVDTGKPNPEHIPLKEQLEEARRLRRQHLEAKTALPIAAKPSRQYRLVIEPNGYDNCVDGNIKRGLENVYGWSMRGVPADLARFLAMNYYYESSPRYFELFLKLTGGAYPIVFRDENGRETPLAYHGDTPCRAGISFDIRGDEVHISRTLDNGAAIPPRAATHGQLLFDPEAGTIQPVDNRDAWNTWDTLVDELDAANDLENLDNWDDNEDEEDFYEPGREGVPYLADVLSLRHLPNAIVAPVSLFNATYVRLQPELLDDITENCRFLHNGVSVVTPLRAVPTYLLDVPDGTAKKTTAIFPLGMYEGQPFLFSDAAFWILNPSRRSVLSAPMKTKKRVRAILDAAFALMDESKINHRTAIIRSVTASSDFSKRDVKREAKLLLAHLSEQWSKKMMLIMAMPDGWHAVEDDCTTQTRMVRILYEMFGTDAFSGGSMPGKLELSTELFLRELPSLASRLGTEGFSLRIGSEPLAAASWEFSLDATRSNQDWFELKPEIRCNGEMLTEEELRGLLDGSGMLRRDGKLMLLDDISAQVLAMFAGAMPSGKKKKKGEQDLVRVPRLQILDWLQLRSHGVQVRLSPDDARILKSLLNFSSIPARPLPQGLNATLRHYQVDAWHWLAFLYEHRFGACLADDMGLGKTVQGITLLAGIMSGELASAAVPGAPHLVVAPPSLLFNWEAELARFLPTARVMLYSGSGRSTEEFANHDVIITSYGIVQRDCDLLADQIFNVLIFDETQIVKNLQAATTNAVRKLKGAFTLALTGTPVENHLGEYYAIMDLCLPGLLGTREEFSRKLNQNGAAATARLIGRTRPFVLRRTKQLIASELPPKIEMDIPLELTTKQRAFYQRTVEEVRGQVKEAYESHATAQARIIALTAILRLRQICLAPALASPGASSASPKLDFLAEQLAELRDEGHSSLVLSQFTGYLDLIEKGLKEQGFTCLRLDGSTPVPQRKKLVQAFQNSEGPAVFLISLKAGGKGLNLTRATYVYHMDPWWNPAVENQASDRAHRIGQTAQVTITRLIMRHTIEEKMMALKERKLQLYKAILDEGAGARGAGLTRDDFEYLLG
jgi:superfamily II DNA or RNA helicase